MKRTLQKLFSSRAFKTMMSALLVMALMPITSTAMREKAYAGNQTNVQPARYETLQDYLASNQNPELVPRTGNDGSISLFSLLSAEEPEPSYAATPHDLYVKYLLVDAAAIGDVCTINGLFSDANLAGNAIVAQYPATADLFDPGNSSDYYIALMDVTKMCGTGRALDAAFAEPDNMGHTIDGCRFDTNTGIAYVPKSLWLNADGSAKAFAVEAQVLVSFSFADASQTSIDVHVNNANPNVNAVASQSVSASTLDLTTTVPVTSAETAGEIDISDITVRINDGPEPMQIVDGGNAAYDPKTGELTIFRSPINVFSVHVEISAPSVFARAYAATDAEADALATFPTLKFEKLDPGELKEGQLFKYETQVDYVWPSVIESGGAQKQIADFCAGYCYGYASDPQSLYDLIAYSEATWGSVDSSCSAIEGASVGGGGLNCMITGPHGVIDGQDWSSVWWPYQGAYHDTNSDQSSITGLKTYNYGYLALQCGHITNPVSVPPEGQSASIAYMRVLKVSLDSSTPYIILGFAGPQVNTQSGCGIYKFRIEGRGNIDLQKASSNTDMTSGNYNYSLAGAEYEVYSDSKLKDLKATLMTDGSGYAKAEDLAIGTYYVKESKSPAGYAKDNTVYKVKVRSGETTRVHSGNVYERPQCARPAMVASKKDAEINAGFPLGGATLAGTEFTVRYYKANFDSVAAAEASGPPARTWILATGQDGHALLDYAHFVGGDSFYLASDGLPAIPLGTVLIQETKPPDGYLPSDGSVALQKIVGSGDLELVESYNAPAMANQVKRGDLELKKVRESDMARLAGVPFRLISESTNEAHVLVTDENGFASTSASWNKHSLRTNVNDNAASSALNSECGVWFGSADGMRAPVNDSMGALPYDTYTLEELRCDTNKDCALIRIEHITIKRNNVIVDMGTIDDRDSGNVPFIVTKASDASDNDKAVTAENDVVVRDHVSYMNLRPGETYTMKAMLLLKSTEEPIEDAVTEKAFVASQPNGFIETEIPVDLAGFDADELVVYEELVCKGTVIAEHKELEDSEQTLRIVPPRISTNAADASDGDKAAVTHHSTKVIDTITYVNLTVGKEYEAEGTLMLKPAEGESEGRPLLDEDGDLITAETSFVPLDTYGKAEVEFEFDSSLLAGRQLVAFEVLYYDGTQIASHEDINDPAQTINIEAPNVKTTATDGFDGDKLVIKDGRATVVDSVRLFNVVEGETYTSIGLMLNTKTGLPLLAGNKNEDGSQKFSDAQLRSFYHQLLAAYGLPEDLTENNTKVQLPITPNWNAVNEVVEHNSEIASMLVSAQAEVVATEPSQTIAMSYSLDALDATGNAVICDVVTHDGNIVTLHADTANADQTVTIAESRIATTAADKTDGDKSLLPSKDSVVQDNVAYSNLLPGQEYELQGVLMDKASGKELVVNDKTSTAKLKFTPNSSGGTVSLELPFDSSQMRKGKKVVVFERLYKNRTLVAEHSDINDASQTVTVSSSTVPADKNLGSTAGTSLGKTGDPFSRWAWPGVVACLVATAGLGVSLLGGHIHRRRRGSK